MGRPLHWIGNVTLAFGMLATASSGHAQSPRPWVDPPPEAPGTTAPASSQVPEAPAAKPVTPQTPP